MRRDLMDILACPLDKAELRLDVTQEQEPGGEVLAGSLTCTQCGEVYPIAEGIPNLLPPDLREAMADASGPTGH
jgi:uncharacterized protein YbaR (Trm112 family)